MGEGAGAPPTTVIVPTQSILLTSLDQALLLDLDGRTDGRTDGSTLVVAVDTTVDTVRLPGKGGSLSGGKGRTGGLYSCSFMREVTSSALEKDTVVFITARFDCGLCGVCFSSNEVLNAHMCIWTCVSFATVTLSVMTTHFSGLRVDCTVFFSLVLLYFLHTIRNQVTICAHKLECILLTFAFRCVLLYRTLCKVLLA